MKANELYEEGLEFEESKDYINAAFKYITAITYDRTLIKAYDKIGNILFYYNNYLAALHCFKSANNLSAIEQCFQKIDQLHYNKANVNDIKGDCYISIGLKLEAQKYYYKALELAEDNELKYELYYKIMNLSQQYYNEFEINYIYNAVNELVGNYYSGANYEY